MPVKIKKKSDAKVALTHGKRTPAVSLQFIFNVRRKRIIQAGALRRRVISMIMFLRK